MDEQFRVVVTAQEGEGPTHASTTPIERADMDSFLEVIFNRANSEPNYLLLSPERYREVLRLHRHAMKRAGTIAQKERAQWKRWHRLLKKDRAALALKYLRR